LQKKLHGEISAGAPPFFILTKNPLLISYLVSIFNLISIIGIIYLASKYLSKTTGLVSGLILATQPWWVIFSRMIYQPTPVVSLMIISMILFFLIIKKPNSIFYTFYIFLSVFLIEIYIHTSSFVVISVLLIILYLKKKIFNKFLVLGVFLSLFLIVPFFVNFVKEDYLPINKISIDESYKIGRDDPITRLGSIIPGYLKTFSGGSMEYQLGYSYNEFYTRFPLLRYSELLILILTIVVIFYHIIKIYFFEELRFERIVFLLWSFSPLFFLILMPLPNVPPIPRYFLISFPSLAILCGLFFSEVYSKTKIVLSMLLIPAVWIFFTYSYSIFINNYDFSNGHLSVYSDSQYLFLFNSIKSAKKDNFNNGHKNMIVSNDENSPKEFSLDYATKYTLTNIYNDNLIKLDDDIGYYLIDYSLGKDDQRFKMIGRFGPYSLYEFKDL